MTTVNLIAGQDVFSGRLSDEARYADLGERARLLEEGRIPFILTCLSWQATGRYIYFWANPSQLDFTFKLRGNTQEVKGGTISYQWRANSAERGGLDFYAEPRLNITFQTGNCMPVRTSDTGELIRIPPGLLDFYEFLELMNQPLVLDDGTMNYRVLFYNSAIFPNMILTGWFAPEEGFSISENVSTPNSTTWTAQFIVRKTSPDFKSASALALAFTTFSMGAAGHRRVLMDSNTVDTGSPGTGQTQDQLESIANKRQAGLEAEQATLNGGGTILYDTITGATTPSTPSSSTPGTRRDAAVTKYSTP